MKLRKFTSLCVLSLLTVTSCSKSGEIRFNKKRDLGEYNEEVAVRMKDSLWESSVSFLKVFDKDNVFSPISLFDLAGVACQLTSHEPKTVLNSLHYTSVEDLDKDLLSYRRYFTFGEKKNEYKSRIASMASLPEYLTYTNGIDKYSDKYQIAFLKNGNEELLKKELSFIKEATFDLLNERWSEDGSFSLSSSIAYTAKFNDMFDIDSRQVDFLDKKTDGFSIAGNMYYYSDTEYTVVSVPLEKEKVIFYLPNNDVLLSSLLSVEKLTAPLTKMKSEAVRVLSPNISLSANNELSKRTDNGNIELADSLLTLGYFDKILTKETLASLLSPEKVKQQIMFELDSDGVEAAASTTLEITTAPMIPERYEVIIDRPFIFSLVDTYNNPLFIGTMNTAN